MNSNRFIDTYTNYSKLKKLNIFLLLTLLTFSMIAVSFATVQNPGLSNGAVCSGMKVEILVDKSKSVTTTGPGVANAQNMRNGISTLVDGISARFPQASFGYVNFAAKAEPVNNGANHWLNKDEAKFTNAAQRWFGEAGGDQQVPYLPIPGYAGIHPAQNGGKDLRGGTNWEDAFAHVNSAATLVILVTDGNPTSDSTEINAIQEWYNAAGNVNAIPSADTVFAESNDVAWGANDQFRSGGSLLKAIQLADIQKTSGKRINGVFISANGADARYDNAAKTLEAVSGSNEGTDYFRATSFATLPATLSALAASIQCVGVSDETTTVPPTTSTTTTLPATTSTTTTTTTTTAPPVATTPKITLEKSGPSTARPGDTVTFTFKVTNTGNVDLTNVHVTDETLSQLAGKTVDIPVPGILAKAGGTKTVTFDWKVPADFTPNKVKNVAVVHSNPVDDPTKDVSDDDDHILCIDRWEVTKTADKKVVVPGETVTYTITVKNTGGSILDKVEVSDPTIGFPPDGKPVIIDLIPVGESRSVTATYTIPKDFEGTTFKNVALVCIPIGPSAPVVGAARKECEHPEQEVIIAKMSLVKSADKTEAAPGEKVLYTFVVTNTGKANINPGVLHDDILGDIGDPGLIEPGKSVTLTKEYTVPGDAQEGDVIHNTATICAPVPDDATSGNAAQEDSTLSETDCSTTCPDATTNMNTLCDQDDHELVVHIPGIQIVKTGSTESASPGDVVTYKFVVTNIGKVTLKNIKVTDNVLGDLGTIDVLEPGQSATLKDVKYTIPANATGNIRNVATACFEVPVYEDNCDNDDHNVSIITVSPNTVERPNLPFTGAQSAFLAAFAAGLIGLGTALFFAARRRREQGLI